MYGCVTVIEDAEDADNDDRFWGSGGEGDPWAGGDWSWWAGALVVEMESMDGWCPRDAAVTDEAGAGMPAEKGDIGGMEVMEDIIDEEVLDCDEVLELGLLGR
jgi:hypothetical protein